MSDIDRRFDASRPGDLSYADDSRSQALTVEELRTTLDRVVTRLDQIADKFVHAIDDIVSRIVISERRLDDHESRLTALEGGRGRKRK